MVDIAKATKVLEDYFANVTKEQFSSDLRKFCPELFEEEEEQAKVNEYRSAASEAPTQAQNGRNLELLTPAEIYHKAKEDHKLEIAAKLLQKGLNAQEVAEILESSN
jgi:hypothetical protein